MIGCDNDIAGQRLFQTATQGETVDPGNNWFRKVPALNQTSRFVCQFLPMRPLLRVSFLLASSVF